MKQAVIQKAADTPVTEEQLAKINRFSRRELAADDVYVFSLLLCDNEVDRDNERFPLPSLKKLAELFVGKTGIFDHNPRGENQTARIFETAVETDENRLTAAGEPYCALRAWAYMARCDKNADLILEIDAGIKKEVSVGCAVERAECSICGADVREQPCAHEAGKEYGGVLCWHELLNPTDAYEWSFVAVPAQKRAGVTKGIHPGGEALLKSLECGGDVTLERGQALELAKQLRELHTLAEAGRARLVEKRKELVRLAAFALPALDPAAVEAVAAGMDEKQLDAFTIGLSKKAPAFLQLGGGFEKPADNGAFCI